MGRGFSTYSKSERQVLLTLLLIGVAALAVICLIGGGKPESETATADGQGQAGRAKADSTGRRHTYYYNVEGERVELFPFDPNTADSTELLRLGLKPWQVRSIYRYRAKGGTFSRKEDFARLYGLTTKQYRQLEPYITIGQDYRPAAETVAQPPRQQPQAYTRDTTIYPKKLARGERVSPNLADTAMLKKVPGIGSARAAAIVGYRERLGGFVSREQLLDIASFPAEALDYFSEPHEAVKKINVNTATKAQLRRHPYLNYYQVKAILDYRRTHGRINSLNDLALNRDFPAEARRRLRPYVDY